jgi:hypothetical protein
MAYSAANVAPLYDLRTGCSQARGVSLPAWGASNPVIVDTLAACLRHRHGLCAFCVKCRRWADLDLWRLVERGYGGVSVAALRATCRVCGARGELLVRPPMPTWGGYHEWHAVEQSPK